MLRRLLIVVSCLFLLYAVTFAHPSDLVWSRVDNLLAGDDDYIIAMAESADQQDIYACVSTHLSGIIENSPVVARLTVTGDTVWTHTYTQFESTDAHGIAALSNGGFVFLITDTAVPDLQFKLVYCDSNGAITNQAAYVVGPSHWEIDATLVPCDGGFALAGVSDYGSDVHLFLARFNDSGEELWTYSADVNGYTEALKASWSEHDQCFLLATDVQPGNGDPYAVHTFRVNADGTEEWHNAAVPFNTCTVGGLVTVPGESILLAGSVEGGSSAMIWLVELDPDSGELLNSSYYGDLNYPVVYDVVLNQAGDPIILGDCWDISMNVISFVAQVDDFSAFAWLETYHGDNHLEFYCGLQHSSGLFFLGGSDSYIQNDACAMCLRGTFENALPGMTLTTGPQPVIVPVEGCSVHYDLTFSSVNGGAFFGYRWRQLRLPDGSLTGAFLTEQLTVGPGASVDFPDEIQIFTESNPAGDYVLYIHAGESISEPALTDSLRIRKVVDNDVADADRQSLPDCSGIRAVYPCPFNDRATVQLHLAQPGWLEVTLYDITGRQVRTLTADEYPAGDHTLTLSAHGLAAGVYLLQARLPNGSTSLRKAVLLK